ncbi:MAG: thioredoxin family protein [Flavobacteriales bacterium]|nr:thioredoxin family protein [Flavobacteriales bacterium]
MKIYKIIFITLVLLTKPLLAQKYPTLEINQKMPVQNYKVKSIDGDFMSLNDNIKNNGILVVFTSNKCPFVIMWEDRYKLIEDECLKSDIGMVYINSNEARRDGDDSIDKMKEHARKMGYKYPYLIDRNSKIANSFGAKTTPHIFLFNKNKKLIYKGAIDDNYQSIKNVKEKYLINAITQLNNNEEIKINTTKAIGCSIKRKK